MGRCGWIIFSNYSLHCSCSFMSENEKLLAISIRNTNNNNQKMRTLEALNISMETSHFRGCVFSLNGIIIMLFVLFNITIITIILSKKTKFGMKTANLCNIFCFFTGTLSISVQKMNHMPGMLNKSPPPLSLSIEQ